MQRAATAGVGARMPGEWHMQRGMSVGWRILWQMGMLLKKRAAEGGLPTGMGTGNGGRKGGRTWGVHQLHILGQ